MVTPIIYIVMCFFFPFFSSVVNFILAVSVDKDTMVHIFVGNNVIHCYPVSLLFCLKELDLVFLLFSSSFCLAKREDILVTVNFFALHRSRFGTLLTLVIPVGIRKPDQ